ncbi:uncharacterized protein TNCV_71341 [Trichonephila clavipes]|nr:uncharacterized protein TNCV_71341 [Trichonephila clavipes]
MSFGYFRESYAVTLLSFPTHLKDDSNLATRTYYSKFLRLRSAITIDHVMTINQSGDQRWAGASKHWQSALLVEWLRQQTKLPHLSEANPQVYVEAPLHPEKMTVWCALWAGGIIGPYFKNDEGHNVTVNGDRYRAMITNFFIPELNNHDVQELWFQQDGAICHTARATID